MKRSSTHRNRTITALAGLLLATSLTSPQAAAKDEGPRAIAGSPLAVSIEGPAGERRRLVHVPGRGWRLIEGQGSAVRREGSSATRRPRKRPRTVRQCRPRAAAVPAPASRGGASCNPNVRAPALPPAARTRNGINR